MTADEIRALSAGRELDAEVARHVMGMPGEAYSPVPRYSTDLATAWEVVEVLRRRFDGVALAALPRAGGWGLTVWDQPRHSSAAQNVVGPVDAGTPALAVCHTALLAMRDGSRHAPQEAR
jgi:hypothetical protein